ncbi:SICA-like antigen [Plasmodium coatneyi]|uniref:SICA-like antigen n=1 Tax=Plasmodium coatneyi TaxID=208452 RepID=A0A1B1DZJ0_9APIC|nr:SICA-like antigen [Plasmodium coatneyi]ANQ08178.1 SICA-like antigen [Plasmodium coatneyi]
MYNVLDDGQDDQDMCSNLDDKKHSEKELCKILARIFLWMDGLKLDPSKEKVGSFPWVPRKEEDEKPKEKELHSYYRCLIGKVTILNMLGKHCMLKEVSETVKNGREEMRRTNDLGEGNQLCKDVYFGSLKLGNRFMWEEIKKEIDGHERENDHSVGLSLVTKGKSKLHTVRDQVLDTSICPSGEGTLDQTILQNLEIKVIDNEDLSLDEATDPPGKKTSGKDELEDVLDKAEKEVQEGGVDAGIVEVLKEINRIWDEKIQKAQEKMAAKAVPAPTVPGK